MNRHGAGSDINLAFVLAVWKKPEQHHFVQTVGIQYVLQSCRLYHLANAVISVAVPQLHFAKTIINIAKL